MKQRIITGLIAGLSFLLVLYLGGYWFMGIIILLAIIGFDEYMRLQLIKRNSLTAWMGWIGLFAIIIPWNTLLPHPFVSFEMLIWILMFLLLTVTVLTKNVVSFNEIALQFIGMIYLGFGFHYMIETRLIPHDGMFWTFFIFACVWGTDSGAYFIGMLLGKRKLLPSISPKKTVEGAIGGIVFSVVVAFIFHFIKPELVSISHAILIGIFVAIIGQMGDLIQSAYKRVRGVKDTGTILPGHGGVLDRVDSWLLVFPFIHLFSLIPH